MILDGAYVLDGVRARLAPDGSVASGPGRLGRAGAAGAVLWQASVGIAGLDLFAGFWRDEAGTIDWLSGFLCDAELIRVVDRLREGDAEEDEPEELYSRASMNTLENDPSVDYR